MAAHTTRKVTVIHSLLRGGLRTHAFTEGSNMSYNNELESIDYSGTGTAGEARSCVTKITSEDRSSKDAVSRVSLLDLPDEILGLIIWYLCPSWSLTILDRPPTATAPLPLLMIPTSGLLLTSKRLHSLAVVRELKTFKKKLIFTTATTPWRVLTKMQSLSPQRLGGYLRAVQTLKFCAPPLFTSRIPWDQLPDLQKIELDYTNRPSNFRCQGNREILDTGWLDWTLVGFARDTEKFDECVGFDAWRAGNVKLRNEALMVAGFVPSLPESNSRAGIEVHVYKQMLVIENPENCDTKPESETGTDDSYADKGHTLATCVVRVSAVYRGVFHQVSYRVIGQSNTTPEAKSTASDPVSESETLVWQRHGKFIRWHPDRERPSIISASNVLHGNANVAAYAGV